MPIEILGKNSVGGRGLAGAVYSRSGTSHPQRPVGTQIRIGALLQLSRSPGLIF